MIIRRKNQTWAAAAKSVLANRAKAIAVPPTDDSMMIVWNHWNKLPEDFIPEEKRAILLGDCSGASTTSHPLHRYYLAACTKDPELPLEPEFTQSVYRAERWAQLIDYVHSTCMKGEDGGHSELVERHWAWEHPVNSAVGRIAILRAARELNFSSPGFTKKTSPSLGDVSDLESRYDAYTKARRDGLEFLRPHWEDLIPEGKQISQDRRAPAVWSSREDVSRALIVAALTALGVCSEGEMIRCRRDDLRRMSPNERRRFEAICRRPAFRGNTVFPLQLWLYDNAPLISKFDLRPDDLVAAAKLRGFALYGGHAGRALPDASKWKLPFKFKRGPRRAKDDERGRRLLGLPEDQSPISPKPLLRVLDRASP